MAISDPRFLAIGPLPHSIPAALPVALPVVETRQPPLSLMVVLAAAVILAFTSATRADLESVQKSGFLRWGADVEGGGPYVYQDENDTSKFVGFEVDLAAALAKELGVKPKLFQGSWANLLLNVDRGDCDIVLNGYEYTPERASHYLSSIPYYIYEVDLLARKNDPRITSWDSLLHPPPGTVFQVGALTASASANYIKRTFPHTCIVREYDSNTNAMALTVSGQLDANVQDSCIAQFYVNRLGRYQELAFIGEPRAPGYYVIYVKRSNTKLIEALNAAIKKLYETGELKRIYDKYGVWNHTQTELPEKWKDWHSEPEMVGPTWYESVQSYLPQFLLAASTTALLACCSMPLAIISGLIIALVRTKGRGTGFPGVFPDRVFGIPMDIIRFPFTLYVELIRGTPLLFQLYVVFFLLPSIGIELPPFWAGVLGLAVNYSAYEAEIFRLGLQAIPKGQLEAAMALGMSRSMAARRIIIPQAIRIVIPATANDFIALFKDTAVCSVIAVTELSKQFTIAYSATNQFVAMAAMTSLLYLMMSYPLSLLAAWLERTLTPEA